MKITQVLLPQLGVNDLSAKIIEWNKNNGDFVNKSEIICSVETTKSVFEIQSEETGNFYILKETGEEVETGECIGLVSDVKLSKEDIDKYLNTMAKENSKNEVQVSEEKKYTEKARILALRSNIDINLVKTNKGKITETDVLNYIEDTKKGKIVREYKDMVNDFFPDNKIQRLAIIGAGDGAIQIIDALSKVSTQEAVVLFDDNKSLIGKTVFGVPVSGAIDPKVIKTKFDSGEFDAAVISISTSIKHRARIYNELSEIGIPFANVIHPTVCVGLNVKLGTGNVILAFCHLGPCAKIRNNNFLSVNCSIEHHNDLGNHCSFGPNVVTSSKVIIEDKVRFGTGIFIEPHLTIGENSIISSGCILLKDVNKNTIIKSHLNYIERKLN